MITVFNGTVNVLLPHQHPKHAPIEIRVYCSPGTWSPGPTRCHMSPPQPWPHQVPHVHQHHPGFLWAPFVSLLCAACCVMRAVCRHAWGCALWGKQRMTNIVIFFRVGEFQGLEVYSCYVFSFEFCSVLFGMGSLL